MPGPRGPRAGVKTSLAVGQPRPRRGLGLLRGRRAARVAEAGPGAGGRRLRRDTGRTPNETGSGAVGVPLGRSPSDLSGELRSRCGIAQRSTFGPAPPQEVCTDHNAPGRTSLGKNSQTGRQPPQCGDGFPEGGWVPNVELMGDQPPDWATRSAARPGFLLRHRGGHPTRSAWGGAPQRVEGPGRLKD